MNRRAFMRVGAGAITLLVAGHQPPLADLELDGLGRVYRRYALFVVGQRDDEAAISIARAVVAVLARFLTNSRAAFARAADARRVGVLIATAQRDVAIMAADSAEALFLAGPPFRDIAEVPLRLIASFGSHVLVCRADFVDRHAYLLAQTLAGHADALPAAASAPEGRVPAHPGAAAFFAGKPLPMA
jgi:hypothetical protein